MRRRMEMVHVFGNVFFRYILLFVISLQDKKYLQFCQNGLLCVQASNGSKSLSTHEKKAAHGFGKALGNKSTLSPITKIRKYNKNGITLCTSFNITARIYLYGLSITNTTRDIYKGKRKRHQLQVEIDLIKQKPT
ncbi:hypothetical protein MtrunA17_Chr4g0029951 [Medicago truncatula]|uniref:Transmembrane protein, putative n=1 Tax=Medicago truncatula TaxID=3880 RepID=G7JQJ3_MEDTR|nr:transmembrane protein, putative [Medicago truncatula]RHN60816.1 hypothetical protein MtrunA17_Chr4g0029951 [Medicago truncatula]